MRNFIYTIVCLAFAQGALASNYRGFDLKQIECAGSNGVHYKITEQKSGVLKVVTNYGAIEKTFYGNSFVTASNDLNIMMGTDKSGYISEYQMTLPLSHVEVESQVTGGMVYNVIYGSFIPVGTVTCSVEYTKGR